jgi:hypothetical protein
MSDVVTGFTHSSDSARASSAVITIVEKIDDMFDTNPFMKSKYAESQLANMYNFYNQPDLMCAHASLCVARFRSRYVQKVFPTGLIIAIIDTKTCQ